MGKSAVNFTTNSFHFWTRDKPNKIRRVRSQSAKLCNYLTIDHRINETVYESWTILVVVLSTLYYNSD